MRVSRPGVVAVFVLVVGLALFGGWYFLLRDDAPPPVNLDDAIASLDTATPSPTRITAASDATAVTSAVPSGPEGTWTVSSAGETFAGYRFHEELSGIGSNTAVGRTGDVSGTLEFDGAAITAVNIEVDVSTLSSDDSRRDNQLRRRGLESTRYPTATFELTSPIPIEAVPEAGTPIDAIASGQLTLHGVTRDVQIALQGQLVDGRLVVVGSMEVALSDYGMTPPTGFIVLSVSEVGTMEFQIVFERLQ